MEGTVKLEDKQRLAQEEESEAKRLAIMTMRKREKYLYQKIMYGKRRKIREVSSRRHPRRCARALRGRWAVLGTLALFLRSPG
jgi:pescadillo protein